MTASPDAPTMPPPCVARLAAEKRALALKLMELMPPAAFAEFVRAADITVDWAMAPLKQPAPWLDDDDPFAALDTAVPRAEPTLALADLCPLAAEPCLHASSLAPSSGSAGGWWEAMSECSSLSSSSSDGDDDGWRAIGADTILPPPITLPHDFGVPPLHNDTDEDDAGSAATHEACCNQNLLKLRFSGLASGAPCLTLIPQNGLNPRRQVPLAPSPTSPDVCFLHPLPESAPPLPPQHETSHASAQSSSATLSTSTLSSSPLVSPIHKKKKNSGRQHPRTRSLAPPNKRSRRSTTATSTTARIRPTTAHSNKAEDECLPQEAFKPPLAKPHARQRTVSSGPIPASAILPVESILADPRVKPWLPDEDRLVAQLMANGVTCETISKDHLPSRTAHAIRARVWRLRSIRSKLAKSMHASPQQATESDEPTTVGLLAVRPETPASGSAEAGSQNTPASRSAAKLVPYVEIVVPSRGSTKRRRNATHDGTLDAHVAKMRRGFGPAVLQAPSTPQAKGIGLLTPQTPTPAERTANGCAQGRNDGAVAPLPLSMETAPPYEPFESMGSFALGSSKPCNGTFSAAISSCVESSTASHFSEAHTSPLAPCEVASMTLPSHNVAASFEVATAQGTTINTLASVSNKGTRPFCLAIPPVPSFGIRRASAIADGKLASLTLQRPPVTKFRRHTAPLPALPRTPTLAELFPISIPGRSGP